MDHNLLVYLATALIPLIVGFLWYGPYLFRNAWMAATGITMEERPGSSKMMLNMLLLYVFSFFVAHGLAPIAIHQMGLLSMLGDPQSHDLLRNPNSHLHELIAGIWSSYGHNFRRYRHGALHGAIAAITLALPIIATSAIFEKRNVKYVLITWGFWFVNFTLMGAVLCHWLVVEMPPIAK